MDIQAALATVIDRNFALSLSELPLEIEAMAVLGSRGFAHALVGERVLGEGAMSVGYRYLAFDFAENGLISKMSII